jgi:hypothetical protein
MEHGNIISYDELDNQVGSFIHNNNEIAREEIIGKSDEGRDIKAVHVTNKDIKTEEKEIVLIIFGRHGDEFGTRDVCLALLDWLTTVNAKRIIDRQHVIIIPAANPDGCFHNIFGLPSNNISNLEKNSILRLGEKYLPDIVMDIHSVGMGKRGFNWGGLEAVIIDENADAGEDQYILRQMAYQMINDAAKAGYPFLLHTTQFYQNLRKRENLPTDSGFNNYVNELLYKYSHSLTFGMEVNHFAFKPEDTAKSGLGVIKSMLRMGNFSFPWEYYTGYPNKLLCGDFLCSIKPKGINAHERRESRKNIWSKRHLFKPPYNPYREMFNDHSVKITVSYCGDEEIIDGITISFRVRGRPKIKKLSINEKSTEYYTKKDICSTYLFLDSGRIKKNDILEIVAEF